MEDYDSSMMYLKRAISINEELNNYLSISRTTKNLGDLYNLKNEYQLAIDQYKKALSIARNIGSTLEIKNSSYGLFNLYENNKRYDSALKYYKTYIAAKDSIMNKEKIKTIAEIETKYETEKVSKENEILRKETDSRKRTQLILIISGIFLFVIAVLLFVLFRIKSRSLAKRRQISENEQKLRQLENKQKETEKKRLEELVFAEKKINELQNEKLSILNQQLSLSAMQVLNKTELLDNIKSQIESNEFKEVKNTDCYQKLVKRIDETKSVDHDWDQFKKHFESVHKGFFEKLNQKYPSLTNNDLKLAAYIRIGLSTKEIARMLNVTTAAVNKSRQRLKKKLDLDISVDLSNYIGEV